jgi:hypothetical protein
MACEAAPNLTMLRLVFEYPASFSIWSPHQMLTDRCLFSLSQFCPQLKILAISKTNGMSHDGFNALLKGCQIKTLDFHRYYHINKNQRRRRISWGSIRGIYARNYTELKKSELDKLIRPKIYI